MLWCAQQRILANVALGTGLVLFRAERRHPALNKQVVHKPLRASGDERKPKGTLMKISVALCTYNGERFLYEQLASIQAQSRQPDELVICDDVSSDRTMTIAREFAANASFPVRIFVNDRTLGSSKNFERAIELCGCSDGIIVLSDQDDVWVQEKLAMIEDSFRNFPETNVVFSNAEVVDHDLQLKGYRLWDAVKFSKKERREVESGQAIRVLLRHNVVTGATMAFRAELCPLVLPVPEGVVHDAWIALLAAVAGQMRIIPYPLIFYRQHGANQIGVTELSLIERIRRPCERAIREARTALCQYEQAHARLKKTPLPCATPALLDDFSQKVEHVHQRISVALRERGWLGRMAAEIVRGRYHRYSVGWWSIGHDLIKCSFLRQKTLPEKSAQ